MSGYDRRDSNTSLNFMSRRLGLYHPDQRIKKLHENTTPVPPNIAASTLDGIQSLERRLSNNGGYLQQDRMVFDKRRTLDRALLYSYQAASIRKVSWIQENQLVEVTGEQDYPRICRALINPNKLKADYDEKIVSVPYEADFHPGDVFEWVGTDTYWIIYLQELTECAYFRGDIRRCQYQINWEDEDGIHSSYVAVRGPVETQINYIQKHQISVDVPNHSLNILMPRTEAALKYFKRYAKFYLRDREAGALDICWRVEAIDWISTPGILEINAEEYYANEFEDDRSTGIAGGLIVDPVNPNDQKVEYYIEGETFIKPKVQQNYTYTGVNKGATWSVQKDRPVKWLVNPDNPLQIGVIWTSPYSGEFEISYGDMTKKIVVESLY